jgi:hypothetical protein
MAEVIRMVFFGKDNVLTSCFPGGLCRGCRFYAEFNPSESLAAYRICGRKQMQFLPPSMTNWASFIGYHRLQVH